jgi:hypothetical protein
MAKTKLSLVGGAGSVASAVGGSPGAFDILSAQLETEAHMHAYERSERLYRWELAVVFSAMLIVLVSVGTMLLSGR